MGKLQLKPRFRQYPPETVVTGVGMILRMAVGLFMDARDIVVTVPFDVLTTWGAPKSWLTATAFTEAVVVVMVHDDWIMLEHGRSTFEDITGRKEAVCPGVDTPGTMARVIICLAGAWALGRSVRWTTSGRLTLRFNRRWPVRLWKAI